MAKPATFRQLSRSQTASLSGNDDSNDPQSSNELTLSSVDIGTESSQGSDSVHTLNRRTGLAAAIRVLSDSLLRMEMVEMEMAKAREAARWEAEKRRLEMEAEVTRMVLQTQLQAVSFGVGRKTPGRKRKRSSFQDPSASASASIRDMGSLFLFLQTNSMFWNSQA